MKFRSESAYLKDTVGLCYLAQLIEAPDRQFSVELLWATRTSLDPALTSGRSGSVIDLAALKSYQCRLKELDEEGVAAHKNQDLPRTEQIDVEKYQVMEALRNALQLSGQVRQQSEREKLRKSVFNAIDRDIRRITRRMPELGKHLQKSIDTGLLARYRSDSGILWRT